MMMLLDTGECCIYNDLSAKAGGLIEGQRGEGKSRLARTEDKNTTHSSGLRKCHGSWV